MLNSKLEALARDFNERLIKVSIQNHLLKSQITKYRILNDYFDWDIPFLISEIDTPSMIKKLLVVT